MGSGTHGIQSGRHGSKENLVLRVEVEPGAEQDGGVGVEASAQASRGECETCRRGVGTGLVPAYRLGSEAPAPTDDPVADDPGEQGQQDG